MLGKNLTLSRNMLRHSGLPAMGVAEGRILACFEKADFIRFIGRR